MANEFFVFFYGELNKRALSGYVRANSVDRNAEVSVTFEVEEKRGNHEKLLFF